MKKKTNLNDNTRRLFALRTVWNGLCTVFSRVTAFFSFAVCVGTLCLALSIWVNHSPSYLSGFLLTVVWLLLLVLTPLLLFAFGYVRGSWGMYDDFCRVGWCNSAGEAPQLTKREKDGNMEVLTFHSKGLVRQAWIDNKDVISSALNRYIVSVSQGNSLQEIVVRCVAFDDVLGSIIPWTREHMDRTNDAMLVLGRSLSGDVTVSLDSCPHWLIASASGGDKTTLCICMLMQAIIRGSKVYIYDGKGGLDYMPLIRRDAQFTDNPGVLCEYLADIQEELARRLNEFREVGVTSISEFRQVTGKRLPRIFLMVDEVSTVLDTHGKNAEQKALISKILEGLAQIAQKGRAVGIHSIYSMQNPSRQELPSAIQANTDKLCGKADPVLSQMVLNSNIADTIPKDSHGLFYLAAGAETLLFQGFYFEKDTFLSTTEK